MKTFQSILNISRRLTIFNQPLHSSSSSRTLSLSLSLSLSLCLCTTLSSGQSVVESIFFNLNGQALSEYERQPQNSGTIQVLQISETDTCLMETLKYNSKGHIIMRTEYNCDGVVYTMRYKEEFEYNDLDCLIWESYISVFNSETNYHYRTHEYVETALGVEKTSVTKEKDIVWDSTITMYDKQNRVMETLSYNFPAPGKDVHPVQTHYTYDGKNVVSIRSDIGNYDMKYDSKGRIISCDITGLNGIFNETCRYDYNRKDELTKISNEFPYHTEFRFDFKNGHIMKKSFSEFDFKTGKQKVSEVTRYEYDSEGQLKMVTVADKTAGTENAFLIEFKSENQIIITAQK